jgi:hypothetical protein
MARVCGHTIHTDLTGGGSVTVPHLKKRPSE